MSLAKSEIKMLTAKALGKDLEERRDKVERDAYRFQGAASALRKLEPWINTRTQAVKDAVLDEEKLPFDPADPVAVGRYIVDEMMKIAKEVHEKAEAAAVQAIQMEGQKEGLKGAIEQVHGVYDEEWKKIEGARQLLESGALKEVDGDLVMDEGVDPGPRPGAPRPPGTHPGLPLKAVRQAEEAAQRGEAAEQPKEGAQEAAGAPEAARQDDVAPNKGNGQEAPAKPVEAKPKKTPPKKKAAPKKGVKKKGAAPKKKAAPKKGAKRRAGHP
jgi:hypothetical protein